MPDEPIDFDIEEIEMLEHVCRQQGLSNVEQAVEWLTKSRMRQAIMAFSGRGRALYEVERKPK